MAKKVLIILLVLVMALAVFAYAKKPPPKAVAACQGKDLKAPCSFEGPDGTVHGVCKGPKGKPLACVPKD